MSQLWEISAFPATNMCGAYTYANLEDSFSPLYVTDGQKKNWRSRPKVVPGIEPRNKKAKPILPIGHIAVGSIVLQPHAVSVIGEFLCQFGELLDVEYEGGLVYFYNCTTLLQVVDFANSKKSGTGKSILRPAFLASSIPTSPVIFKDPLTASTSLYVSNAAREWLEPMLAEHKLAGLRFYPAGTV
jgi:hypothetical protein